MLAERRKKTKWIINPTKKPLWATDSSGIKFGKEMMEKMGWSTGKGLGSKEQGIVEPLKVSYKNDTKGMGFKGNDDDWIEYQDEFNSLLTELSNGTNGSPTTDQEKVEIKSLEEKSKKSKARVHYQKFTRGKDLSRYSENDLACILGTNRIKEKKELQEKEKEKEKQQLEEPEDKNCLVTSFGVSTINSGSIDDYFKRKLSEKKGNNIEETGDKISQNNFVEEITDESCKKKSKKRKHESIEFEETNDCGIMNGDGELETYQMKHKKKKKKKDVEEQEVVRGESDSKMKENIKELDDQEKDAEVIDDNKTKKKKRKRNDSDEKDRVGSENVPENTDENHEVNNEVVEETSKRKKSKKKTKEKELKENVDEELSLSTKTEKKKKKREKSLEYVEEPLGDSPSIEENKVKDDIPVKKKKKKKSKEVDVENDNPLNDDVEKPEKEKHKKKKKEKKELEHEIESAEEGNKESPGGVENIVKSGTDEVEVKNERVNDSTKAVIYSHKPELFKKKKVKGSRLLIDSMDLGQLDHLQKYGSKRVLKTCFNVAIEDFRGCNVTSLPGYGVQINKQQKR